jgi:hypothetical protein
MGRSVSEAERGLEGALTLGVWVEWPCNPPLMRGCWCWGGCWEGGGPGVRLYANGRGVIVCRVCAWGVWHQEG